MTSFNPKSATYSKDIPLAPSSIEAKRAKVIFNIDRCLAFRNGDQPETVEGKNKQSPIWLSRLEGDKRHYRLKHAQRNLAIGPKGEELDNCWCLSLVCRRSIHIEPYQQISYCSFYFFDRSYDGFVTVVCLELFKT